MGRNLCIALWAVLTIGCGGADEPPIPPEPEAPATTTPPVGFEYAVRDADGEFYCEEGIIGPMPNPQKNDGVDERPMCRLDDAPDEVPDDAPDEVPDDAPDEVPDAGGCAPHPFDDAQCTPNHCRLVRMDGHQCNRWGCIPDNCPGCGVADGPWPRGTIEVVIRGNCDL